MNITQETNNMGIFIHFRSDTQEEIEEKERWNTYKKIFTSDIYKRIYDAKILDKDSMRALYELLREDLKS